MVPLKLGLCFNNNFYKRVKSFLNEMIVFKSILYTVKPVFKQGIVETDYLIEVECKIKT